MKTEDKESKKRQAKELLLNNYKQVRLKVFKQTAIHTVGLIIAFGLIGYLLDKTFDTYPKLLIGGVVISYPVNLWLTRKRFKKFANNQLTNIKNGRN